MLQYLTQSEDRFSILEQCQMVIEGGCAWIQLRLSDESTDFIRHLSDGLVPLCKEKGTILIVEDKPQLAREFGLHGIHITLESHLNAAKLREELGPEPIIGVEVNSLSQIEALKDHDIDYFTLSSDLNDFSRSQICAGALSAGNIVPIVFAGNFTIADSQRLRLLGANGICTGRHIVDAPDPVKYTSDFITALNNCTM